MTASHLRCQKIRNYLRHSIKLRLVSTKWERQLSRLLFLTTARSLNNSRRSLLFLTAAPSLDNSRRSLLFLTTAWSLEPDNSVGYTCYRARLPHRRQCRQLPSPTYYNRSTYSRGLLQSTPAIPLEHCRVLGHLRARSCCCDLPAISIALLQSTQVP